MADTQLTIVLNAKNLTGPAFKEIEAAVTKAGGTLSQAGKAGQKAGEDIAGGMSTAAKSTSTAASAISQGLGVAIPLSAAAAVTAVVAFGVDSVKTFAEFDKQVHGVNSLLGLTGDEAKKSFTAMSADIRGFATRMGVDAVGATKALYDIVSSGVTKPADAMKVLEVAQRAAIGGMTDAATTADGLTSVLNAYGLSADHADEVSDQMFQTVNIGKVTMGELSSQIGKVVPIAAALGVGFDQVGGAIATMTKQGITAGAAFTDTQQILNQYLKPTAEAAELSKALGFEFNATALRADGLQGSLNKAFDASGGNKELLGRLFGSVEAVNGVLALTGHNSEAAATDLEGVGHAAGAQAKAFDEMEGSASRNAEKMQAKFKEVGLKLGESMVEPLTNIAKFVDLVGQNLGLWPKDVPSSAQVGNMRGLGDAAKDTAAFVLQIRDAYVRLDEEIRKTQKNGANPEDIGGAFGKAAREAVIAASKGTDAYTKKQMELSGAVRAGTITQAEADKQLAAWVATAERAAVANKDYRSEQTKLDEALQGGQLGIEQYTAATAALKREQEDQAKNEAQGNQGKVDSLGLVQQQIDAAIASAAAERKAAAEKQAAADASSKSAAQRVADAEKAAKAEKEAQAATKAATEKAIADAKRYAEQVAQATERAAKSYNKLEDDIADIVDDGNGRLQEIRDRHDQDYNQSIIDAQADQSKIYADGEADRTRIVDEAGKRRAEVQARLDDLVANRDEQAADHRLQESRRLADQDLQDTQRAEDRKLEVTRRADDLRASQDERNADRRLQTARRTQDRIQADDEKAEERRLDRVKANAEREQQIREDAAARKNLETGAGDDSAEREKQKARDVADARKQFDRDVAQENSDYADALADDEDGKNKARTDREHAQALARLQERFDADAAKREERYGDEEAKAQAQLERDLGRADAVAQKRLADLKAREDEQVAVEDRADKREAAARKLSDDRAKEDLETADKRDQDRRKVQDDRDRQDRETADRRDQIARNTQEARAKADWDASRVRAAKALADDLKKIEDKKNEDIKASQEREAAAIKASNDTLIEKQRQIDAQRDTDFGKFSEDLGRRFRELGQQFGQAMGDLEKMIPAKVNWFISGGAGQIAAAAAQLNAGSTPGSSGGSSGATLREGGKPGETAQEVANFQANAQKAHEDNIRKAAGLGAGGTTDDPSRVVYEQIIADLDTTLGGINQRYGQALIGGDSATAAGKAPPATIKPAALGVPNEGAIGWAEGNLGSKAFNGMCERFVEMAHGTSGIFASAAAAAGALQQAGGRMEDAPRGALVFFRPDVSNGGYGHVGIAEGGGRFISATNAGVTIDGPSAYWSKLYTGYGAPNFQRRQYGGPLKAGQPAIVGESGREVFVPDQDGTVLPNSALQPRGGALAGTAQPGAGTINITLEIDGQRFASAMAPYNQGALDRQVRLRLG